VQGGIDMLNAEKCDVVFFTGDLVNDETPEMKNYMDVFDKIKAPMGVFSILGNHDYGDYREWASAQAKQQNLEDLYRVHKNLGWDLLRNENRILKQGGESLAIIGVENWSSSSRFPKKGRLDIATQGTEESPVKLLLSHDPSHWNAQVTRDYKDIDMMFAGHTHGMQFGIEIGNLKWSPAQYVYPEWSGLYEKEQQKLYVNVGYGFLGYPGRIGILPEITIFELLKA
jgi:predicted MPP superfamily phosphohydrolase